MSKPQFTLRAADAFTLPLLAFYKTCGFTTTPEYDAQVTALEQAVTEWRKEHPELCSAGFVLVSLEPEEGEPTLVLTADNDRADHVLTEYLGMEMRTIGRLHLETIRKLIDEFAMWRCNNLSECNDPSLL